MTQFHAGQEVDVLTLFGEGPRTHWCKAKIVRRANIASETRPNKFHVQFPDGTRAVFDAAHIRARAPFSDEGMGPYSEGLGP